MQRSWTATGLVMALTSATHGQAPLAQQQVPQAFDSGWLGNDQPQRAVIFSETVEVIGAPWLRLYFERADLGHAPTGGEPTVLRLTSLLDGAEQRHTTSTLQHWQNSSAYFNGDRVRVELLADPGAGLSLLRMSSATAGAAGSRRRWTGHDLRPRRRSSAIGRSSRRSPATGRVYRLDHRRREPVPTLRRSLRRRTGSNRRVQRPAVRGLREPRPPVARRPVCSRRILRAVGQGRHR